MRLSMEEVQKMKNWFTNYVSELSELGKKVRDIFSIEEAQNLFDTIEALQHENEQIKESFKKYGDIAVQKGFLLEEVNLDNVRRLEQENEQLQVQVARMREALDELTSELDYASMTDNGIEWDKHKSVAFDKALDILNMKPIDYHNPADVEALRKAREAIKAAWSDGSANAAMDKASEALAEIDKVLGG